MLRQFFFWASKRRSRVTWTLVTVYRFHIPRWQLMGLDWKPSLCRAWALVLVYGFKHNLLNYETVQSNLHLGCGHWRSSLGKDWMRVIGSRPSNQDAFQCAGGGWVAGRQGLCFHFDQLVFPVILGGITSHVVNLISHCRPKVAQSCNHPLLFCCAALVGSWECLGTRVPGWVGAESLPLILLSGPVYISQEKEEPLKTVACSAFASQALLGCVLPEGISSSPCRCMGGMAEAWEATWYHSTVFRAL